MNKIEEIKIKLRQVEYNLLAAKAEMQTLKHDYVDALDENRKLKDKIEFLNTQVGLLKAENDTLTKNNIDLRMEVQRMQRRSLWDIVAGRCRYLCCLFLAVCLLCRPFVCLFTIWRLFLCFSISLSSSKFYPLKTKEKPAYPHGQTGKMTTYTKNNK